MKKLVIISVFVCLSISAVTVRNDDIALLIIKFTNQETGQSEVVSLNKSTPRRVSTVDSSKSMGKYPLVTIFKPLLPVRVTLSNYDVGVAIPVFDYPEPGTADITIDTRIAKPDIITLNYNPNLI